jgi:hypothetical protein
MFTVNVALSPWAERARGYDLRAMQGELCKIQGVCGARFACSLSNLFLNCKQHRQVKTLC